MQYERQSHKRNEIKHTQREKGRDWAGVRQMESENENCNDTKFSRLKCNVHIYFYLFYGCVSFFIVDVVVHPSAAASITQTIVETRIDSQHCGVCWTNAKISETFNCRTRGETTYFTRLKCDTHPHPSPIHPLLCTQFTKPIYLIFCCCCCQAVVGHGLFAKWNPFIFTKRIKHFIQGKFIYIFFCQPRQ